MCQLSRMTNNGNCAKSNQTVNQTQEEPASTKSSHHGQEFWIYFYSSRIFLNVYFSIYFPFFLSILF